MLHGLYDFICKVQHLVPQRVNNHLLAMKTKEVSWMPPGEESPVSQSPAALSDGETRAMLSTPPPPAAMQ